MPIQLCTDPSCRNYGHYCRIHLKDVVKEKIPIAKVNDGRKEQEKEYLKLRKVFLRDHPFCKECGQPATDIHHAAGKIGDKLLDVADFVPLCRKHHQYYEVRPIEAKEKGISKSRLRKKQSV
jgi:hypothetical protein